MKVQIVNKSNNPLPQYKTKGSVGMDICANESTMIEPSMRRSISTGLYINIPEGFEAQIRPRSGLALYNGITILNTPGTIDSDYRGEIKIILYNTSDTSTFNINIGDRIAQIVICPIEKVELEEVEELDSTERGEGGFGSTGITSAITAETISQPEASDYYESLNSSLFDEFYDAFNIYDNYEQQKN